MINVLIFINGSIFEILFFLISVSYKIQSKLERREYSSDYNITYEMFGLVIRKKDSFGGIVSPLNNNTNQSINLEFKKDSNDLYLYLGSYENKSYAMKKQSELRNQLKGSQEVRNWVN